MWWKKVLSIISIFVTGYEVAKVTDTNDKEIVKYVDQVKKIEVDNDELTHVEKLFVIIFILIVCLFIFTKILKFFKKKPENVI